MKKYVLLLFLCINIFSMGGNIDSLMVQSQEATAKTNLRGLFIGKEQKVMLTPPDILFRTPETRIREIEIQPYANTDAKIRALENEIASMSLNIEKLTFISKNLIEQSESHSKNSNLLTKLVEALITALGAIIVGYFINVVFKKKK